MKRLIWIISLLSCQVTFGNDLSVITAEGFGFSDANRFSEPQARLMALRAAKIDAQRNLLEVINGVRVTAGTTVKDMMLESDIIGTRVKGMLQGSFETDSSVAFEDGSWVASVKMAVCMDKSDALCRTKPSLASITQPSLVGAPAEARYSVSDLPAVAAAVILKEAAAPQTAPEPVASAPAPTVGDQSNRATGLILDARALNYTPMLDVRVRTGSGKELYGPGHVPMGSDWLHWAPSVVSANEMADIVGDAPLVMTPKSLGEATELVISDNDAIKLFTSNTLNGDFLAAGKVVIVVAGS
ncbi:MAG: hypothetical protein QNL18_02875 [Pseudomonadales bacterium]|jgi:hypothetical protein|tara:strand:- start:187 stop:1083 length:897 start_codon:yes stop_codon:yes gene_type:complete